MNAFIHYMPIEPLRHALRSEWLIIILICLLWDYRIMGGMGFIPERLLMMMKMMMTMMMMICLLLNINL